MRTRTTIGLAAALAIAAPTIAFAPPGVPMASPATAVLTGDPGPGYFATPNVEWLGMIPFNSGSAGARVVGDRLYVTDQFGITIYDLTDPTLPTPISFTPSPQQYYFTEEDVTTNGEILVVGSFGELAGHTTPLDTIFVYDVSNPTPSATLLGTLSSVDADQHTLTCILDCTWVLGSEGAVIDLTDPTAPTMAGNWAVDADLNAAGIEGSHDVTEVRPGLVMISSNPIVYADFRVPTDPAVLSIGALPDTRFIHGNLWPGAGTDDLLLVGGEDFGDCNDTTGAAFMTFAAADVRDGDPVAAAYAGHDLPGNSDDNRRDGRGSQDNPGKGQGGPAASSPEATPQFRLVDEYRVGTGIYTDGDSPYNQFCAHWFTTEPGFHDGGLVAAAWYEHGTRFLDVAPDGSISERGWFVPLGGSQSAAYFITEDIVLTTDYQRGIDILRIDRNAPASPGEDNVVMVGQAAAVAAGTVDPDSFFPWFGRESVLGAPSTGLDAAGNYICPLPLRRA